MKTPRLLAAYLFAALLLAGCASSQQTASDTYPQSGQSAEDTDIRVSQFNLDDIEYPAVGDFQVPEPKRIELDNGLTVFLLEDRSLPQVNASARIGVGSVWEPDEKRGLADITGTVMRTGGSASMSPDEVNQTLEDVGATVETSIGSTSGSAFMSTLTDYTDEVLPIFVDVLTKPAFAPEKVDLAKQRQKSSISRRNDDPQQIAFRELSKLIYGPGSPYAHTPEYYTIDRIQKQDLEAFHDQYYHPNNTILSVWGDFDADQMAGKIRAAFSDWERADGFERPALPPVEGDEAYSVNFIQKSDVTQSTVLMGHAGEIKRSNPDYFPVLMMNEVLSGGFTSRLFQTVRTEKGLAYAVFGSYSAGYDRDGLFRAGVFSKSASTVEAGQAVLDEVQKMREKPPTQKELDLAKDSYLNSFVFNFDTRREILNRLMTYAYYDYPADFLQQIKNGVEQVTTDDVFRVAKKYLHPDDVDVVVLGNEDDFDQPVASLAKGGDVNEIDITIPTQPPGEADAKAAPAMNEADRAAGKAKLMQVREALGGSAFDAIDNVKTTGKQVVNSQMGEVTLQTTTTLQFPDKAHIDLQTPQGTMSIILNGGAGVRKTPMGNQQIPAQTLKAQLWRDLTYLMARAGDDTPAAVQDQGTQEVDGQTYQALRIRPPAGDPYTLYVDPETMRPARMTFQAMTQQGPKAAYTTYGDYRETASGVMVPYATTTYQGDKQASSTTVQNVTINADVTDDAFDASTP